MAPPAAAGDEKGRELSGRKPARAILTTLPSSGLHTTGKGESAQPLLSPGRQTTKTQFIVVSHRPQVYEQAKCLVGLYSYHHTSRSITHNF